MGLVTLLKNYLRWTQAVVLGPLIVGARRPWLKIAWSMLLVTTTAAFVVQSYFLVTDHLSYKTSTEIRLIYEPQAPFPAVTFCNLNPFKKSMVEHSQELTNLVATYMYVIKMKQAQIANGTTATARATTSNENESNARRKRQAEAGNGASIDPAMSECEETEYTYNVTASDGRFISQEVYSVWNCSNGSAFMDFGACGVEMRTKSFPASKLNSWKNDMATIFYKCFYRFCTEGNNCTTWANALSALTDREECLRTDGPAIAALDVIVAQALASHCDYSDASCTIRKMITSGTKYSYKTDCSTVATTASEPFHNRVVKHVNNARYDDDAISEHSRDHTDVDYRAAGYTDRTFDN